MGGRHKHFKVWMLIKLINERQNLSKNSFFNGHALSETILKKFIEKQENILFEQALLGKSVVL